MSPSSPSAKKTSPAISSIASEFEPYQEISVYAKVSGYIKKLHINWGTHVDQGQLLAVLEIPELQQQLQQDEACVRRSEQDLARAQEELNRSESAYNVTHLTYTRLANVQKTRPELVAQEEIDVAQGKDLEAKRRRFERKGRARRHREQELLGAKAALEKDQALYRIRAHHGALRRRRHAKWTPTPARCFPPELHRTRAIRRSAIFRRTIFSVS